MKSCRLCFHPVIPFLNMGPLPLPEELRTRAERSQPVKRYPLGLSVCTNCHHIQLTKKVGQETIYRRNYFYDYSLTQTGKDHWKKLVSEIVKRYRLNPKDLVIDIGSNTGLLLSLLAQYCRILGVDPNPQAVREAKKRGVGTLNTFFTLQTALSIRQKLGFARIITCTNTFDHLDNLSSFMSGLDCLLASNGIVIVEVPYLWNMLINRTHIPYHQQIDYIAIMPLIPFFQKYGFEIFDAEEIDMHGGSLRIFLARPKIYPVTPAIAKLLAKEIVFYKNFPSRLRQFKQKLEANKKNLLGLLKQLKHDDKRIAACGASAKGITLFNYCGLGPETIDFITEKSPLKIGRFTASDIPIVSDETLFSKHPDYVILLAWNFQKEVIANLKGFKGTWIIPVPNITKIS